MKRIDWKMLSLTIAVCLLPVLFGIFFYEKMPEMMPIHFNINNEVDRYAPKNFALFGIPILMTMLQIFCYILSDWKGNQNDTKPKFITVVKWIIPILSVVISVIMIEIALGSDVDVRKSIILVLGIMYIVMGNYFPKMSYEQMKGKIHPMPKDEKMYRKMTRILGYTFVIFGFALLGSIFLESMVSFGIIITMIVTLLLETVLICRKNK